MSVRSDRGAPYLRSVATALARARVRSTSTTSRATPRITSANAHAEPTLPAPITPTFMATPCSRLLEALAGAHLTSLAAERQATRAIRPDTTLRLRALETAPSLAAMLGRWKEEARGAARDRTAFIRCPVGTRRCLAGEQWCRRNGHCPVAPPRRN